ncbi:Ctr copper transporter family-domain-containing protein [Lipomyces chichibuensis]|uniref:Ctr copper transporter family-domain-containing protein n=1 Tax=Lipomyces chichibuensis TaxID=1546026 RepID=UPI003343FFC7
MDHSQHMGHLNADNIENMRDFGESAPCKTHMLFTWDSEDLCIVFDWWHIRSRIGFFVSLLAVLVLSLGYEYFRAINAAVDLDAESLPGPSGSKKDDRLTYLSRPRSRIYRAAFYALQVMYSFFLMLVFMTYNGWIMLAVVGGAFAGHLLWSSRLDRSARGMFCH